MSKPLSFQALGAGLGITKQAAWRLAKRGMPRDSGDAAHVWRERNLHPDRRKRPSSADATVDGQR